MLLEVANQESVELVMPEKKYSFPTLQPFTLNTYDLHARLLQKGGLSRRLGW